MHAWEQIQETIDFVEDHLTEIFMPSFYVQRISCVDLIEMLK